MHEKQKEATKEAVAPQVVPRNGQRAVQKKDAKSIKNDAKKSTKRNLNPPACSGDYDKSMTEQSRRKEEKYAKKKHWIPAGTVNGGEMSAEKAGKMSKKRQKGDRHPPCTFVVFEN